MKMDLEWKETSLGFRRSQDGHEVDGIQLRTQGFSLGKTLLVVAFEAKNQPLDSNISKTVDL